MASLPDNNIFFTDMHRHPGVAVRDAPLNAGGVQRDRYLDNEAGGGEPRLKSGLDRDRIR